MIESPAADSLADVFLPAALAAELTELHPRQRAAALHQGPLVVLAGPGAGKTRTLVARVGYLLAHVVSEHRGVAAITYTDAAAAELAVRLERLGVRPGRRLATRTVHSFCLQHILRPYGEFSGQEPAENTQIIDDTRAERLWERAAEGAGIPLGRNGVRSDLPTLQTVRRLLAAGLSVATYQSRYASAVRDYEQRLRRGRLLDFEAMTTRALEVVSGNEAVRKLIAARFPYIVVDEYQDLGPVLHRLVLELASAGVTVTAVGDPDQTMYEFQGADPRYLRELHEVHHFTAIPLVLNYRSGDALIAAGRAALGADRGYESAGTSVGAGEVTVRHVDGTLAAHAGAAAEVVRDAVAMGTAPEEIAVLYRGMDFFRDLLADAMTSHGIAFDIERGARVPRSPLSSLVGGCTARRLSGPVPGPEVPLGRLARSPALAPTVSALAKTWHMIRVDAGLEIVDETPRALARGLVEVLDDVGRETAAEDCGAFYARLSQVLDLNRMAEASRDGRDRLAVDVLDTVVPEGLSMAELAGGRAPGRTVITTYHSAKGREFSLVVLPGLVDGFIPFVRANSVPSAHSLAVSRREFYVAVTRAQNGVVLLTGDRFEWFGNVRRTRRSRFVDDICAALGL